MSNVKYVVEALDFSRNLLKMEGYGYTLYFTDADLKWLDEGGIPVMNKKGFPIMPSDKWAATYYRSDINGNLQAAPKRATKALVDKPADERTDTTTSQFTQNIEKSLSDDLDFLNGL